MQKNVAGQSATFFAWDSATGLPKSGDAANITPYLSKDWGTVTVFGSPTMTEMDATNAKGFYKAALAQAESNANDILFSGKSTTTGIVVVGYRVTTTVPVQPYYTGTAAGGSAAGITFAASTPQGNVQPGDVILIIGGTGSGQSNIINSVTVVSSFVTAATVLQNWVFANPDNTSIWVVIKLGSTIPGSVTDAWSNIINPTRNITSPLGITQDASFAARETTLGTPATTSVSGDIAAVNTAVGGIQTKLGTPAGASVSVDIASVKANTGTLASILTPTRAGYLDNLSAGAVAQQTTVNAIATKTGNLKFSASGNVTADVEEVKASAGLSGNGSSTTPWGPP